MLAWADLIPRAVLSITTDTSILIFLVAGFYSRWHAVFVRTTLIVLFGLFFNFFLKSLFQVPLDPALHVGQVNWAFPSGHTALAMSLYGWLAIETRRPAWMVTALLWVLAIGFSLVHFHYHDWSAVLAAMGIMSVVLFLYFLLSRVLRSQDWPVLGLVFSVLGLLMIFSLLPYRVNWLWQVVGLLTGFSLGLWLHQRYLEPASGFNASQAHASWFMLSFKIIFAVVGVFSVHALFNALFDLSSAPFLTCLQYFLMALWYTFFVDLMLPYLKRFLPN